MAAEVTKRMVPRWTSHCDECDVWLGNSLRPNITLLQRHADRHNRYCHSEELIPHTIAHVMPKLIGYTVECICGATSSAETTNMTHWHCPLDRTVVQK